MRLPSSEEGRGGQRRRRSAVGWALLVRGGGCGGGILSGSKQGDMKINCTKSGVCLVWVFCSAPASCQFLLTVSAKMLRCSNPLSHTLIVCTLMWRRFGAQRNILRKEIDRFAHVFLPLYHKTLAAREKNVFYHKQRWQSYFVNKYVITVVEFKILVLAPPGERLH